MAFTQAQLDALNEAIASGVRMYVYGNRTINYNSLDEMLKARDIMKRELQGSAAPVGRTTVAAFDRGR